MKRNKNVVLNMPADGLAEEVVSATDLSEEEYRAGIKRFISEFLKDTSCGRVFLNVCYKRSVVPSETADSFLYNILTDENGNPIKDKDGKTIKEISPELPENMLNVAYRELMKRNIDLIGMAIEEIREYEAEVWFSVRMNDHHYPEEIGFNSKFAYERAEELGVNGSKTYIDYTKTPVQNYYRNYIEELCRNYDIDGIELDYLRSCPIMSEVTEENKIILNNYVSGIKEVVSKVASEKGRNMGLAVRVYPEEHMNLEFGMDVAKWVAEGLIDILVLEGWYIPTYYDIPVDEWRNSIDSMNKNNHPYTILCGTDWAVKCDLTRHEGRAMWISLEQFKGFVSASYARGADGIYIFNHFNTNDENHAFENMALYSYYLDEDGKEIRAKVLKEKILSADSQSAAEEGIRCYVNTYTENSPYPISVTPGRFFEKNINTGTKPEAGQYNILVGINESGKDIPVKVEVEGVPAVYIKDAVQPEGFVFESSEIPYPFVNHVSEVARRVLCFKADTECVKDKFNHIKISANGNSSATVKWIEIQVAD